MDFLTALKEADEVVMWMHTDGCGYTVKVAKAAIKRNGDLVKALSEHTADDEGTAEDREGKIVWQYDGQTLALN